MDAHEFVDACLDGDYASAETKFQDLMKEKVSAALNSRKVELAQALYQQHQGD